MNRRDFVKALAGIPLLGLLARLTKAEGGLNPNMPNDLGHIDVWDSKTGRELFSGPIKPEDWLVERYKDENGDWHERVLVGSPPADLHWDEESLPGLSFWNGQKWIPAELQQRMCFH